MKDHESRSADAAGVGEEVRTFFQRHPDPPPVDSFAKYRHLWQVRQQRWAAYYLFWPAKSFREDHSLLIAGCGTSLAAQENQKKGQTAYANRITQKLHFQRAQGQ